MILLRKFIFLVDNSTIITSQKNNQFDTSEGLLFGILSPQAYCNYFFTTSSIEIISVISNEMTYF